jgi:hypothetical protein
LGFETPAGFAVRHFEALSIDAAAWKSFHDLVCMSINGTCIAITLSASNVIQSKGHAGCPKTPGGWNTLILILILQIPQERARWKDAGSVAGMRPYWP